LAVLDLAAARAAPAIERAKLLDAVEREHRNAVMLQRSLLPRRLGAVQGVTVAARYLPARDEVGGDWYDMIQLPHGRAGIVIGDVAGHGLAAATLMGQLRTALHAYALAGHGPAQTLRLVDYFVGSLEEEVMASAALAVVDQEKGMVTFASAGHLPPILLSADGRARAVEVAPAPPLGAFGFKECPQHELPLDPGEMMLLYTDGLIERRGVSLWTSIDTLVAAVTGVQTPEEACLMAMDRLVPQRGPTDDVAVIAVQNNPVPAVLELEMPAYPKTLARLRQALKRWLQAQGVEREVEIEITIAVSEACANAIEHAYGPSRGTFTVRAEQRAGCVEVNVRDQGRWQPPRGEQRGRGLKIIEAAMDDVDVHADNAGTTVTMRRRLRH
jgi:anti-sigma regulatory factor (Ser/Thr protein kinase)